MAIIYGITRRITEIFPISLATFLASHPKHRISVVNIKEISFSTNTRIKRNLSGVKANKPTDTDIFLVFLTRIPIFKSHMQVSALLSFERLTISSYPLQIIPRGSKVKKKNEALSGN